MAGWVFCYWLANEAEGRALWVGDSGQEVGSAHRGERKRKELWELSVQMC